MPNIKITDKQTVTPTGSDFMLINQAGSDKNTTLARLKTYTNGGTALETVAQEQNAAINEVNKIATNNSTAINGINTKIGSGTLETTSQNYVGAINEINKKVGNEKLETVAENTTGAVNELNKKIGNIDVENDGTVATQLNEKVNKTDIVNNTLATIEGKVLDATVAKLLNDKIDKIKFATMLITANEFAEGTGTDTLTFVISGSETNLFSTKPLYVNVVGESFTGYLERYNFDESTDEVIKISLKNTKGNFEDGLSYRYGILIVS